MQQQRVAFTRAQLVIVSHDFDVGGTVSSSAQRQNLLENGVEADRSPGQVPRSGEDQQIAHDFRRGRLHDKLSDLPAQLFWERSGGP